MPFKAIIFDHDGTLVDSEGVHFSIWHKLLKELHIDFSKEAYQKDHCGVPSLKNAQLLVEHYETGLTAEQLCLRKQAHLSAWLEQQPFPLMPLAREALQACRDKGLKIGLATGASDLEAGATLSGHQLQAFFDVVVTKDQVRHSKPAPDTYLLAMEKLGVEAAQCVAIEDSFTGVAAAKAAHLTCVSVSYEPAKQHDLSRADAHAKDLLDAVEQVFLL